MQETIYAIGNSHVNIFASGESSFQVPGESKGFKSYPIGPTIAYNFTQNHLPIVLKTLMENKVPLGSKVLLVVGEVDCRWHLPYQSALQKRSTSSIVAECVERFMGTFDALQEVGYQPCGWGGHPTTDGPHNDDQNQPVFGDMLYRNAIAWHWKETIKNWCKNNNWGYYSIFEKLVWADLTTRTEFMQDYCHLSTSKVRPFINEVFGITE